MCCRASVRCVGVRKGILHVKAFLLHMEINPLDSERFRWVAVRSTATPIVANLPADTWPNTR
jgi:hypothetical protein